MSTNTGKITLEVTPEQAEFLLSLLPSVEAPSTKVEGTERPCGATTKAGTPCKNTVGNCRHHTSNGVEVPQPKAKASKKEAPKGKVTLLRKATRKAFIAAAKKEHGVDLSGLSTKEVARRAVTEGLIPTGFEVGEGYRELVS